MWKRGQWSRHQDRHTQAKRSGLHQPTAMLGLGPSRWPFPGGQDGTGARARRTPVIGRRQIEDRKGATPLPAASGDARLGHHMPTTGLCTPPTVPRASSAGALAASSCGPHQRPAAGRGRFWQKRRIPADLRRMHTNSPSPLRPKRQADVSRDSSPPSAFPESLNCSWETSVEMQRIPLLTNTESKPTGSVPLLPPRRLLTHAACPSMPPTTRQRATPSALCSSQTPEHCAALCPSSTTHRGTGPLHGTGLPPNKRHLTRVQDAVENPVAPGHLGQRAGSRGCTSGVQGEASTPCPVDGRTGGLGWAHCGSTDTSISHDFHVK